MAVVKISSSIQSSPVTAEGARNSSKRLLIGASDGAPLFSMRMFEIGENGNTPDHEHGFEHEIFVLEGNGKIITATGTHAISNGASVFIPAGERHTIVNSGKNTLRILCVVPREYE